MTDWYKKSFRRSLVDMHIEEWDKEFLSKFDPDEYFQALKTGNVQSPMIYIQSHVGYCYWPTTDNGHMHNAFKGRESAMRRLFDLCHDDGMDVIAYYSLIFNNWAYEAHPEWRMLNIAGKGSRSDGSRYGLCCPNSQGYREFVFTQIKEFCSYFDFEGIFFDMTFWPMICYCDDCKARWAKEVGGEIPAVIDWSCSRWLQLQKKRQEWLGEFAEVIRAELKKYKPDCSVEHQFSTAMHFWRFGVNENISKASDYAGGDLYGGIAEQSFACKLYYNLTQNQPFEYMTSRCYPNLLEHTTTKTIDLLKLSVMTTFLHHGACVMIDAIDPIGTIDRRVYEKVGEVFHLGEKYESYFEGEHIEDVGIYCSLNGKMDVTQKGVAVGTTEAECTSQPHLNAALGAANSLREHHIPYGVVNNWKLDLFKKLRVLVLPDVPLMEDREIEAVRDFVRNGGSLYLSGHTAPKLVEELFNVTFEGFTEEANTYIAPTVGGADIMHGFTKEYPMTLFVKQAKLSGPGRGELLATITLPYTIPFADHTPATIEYSLTNVEFNNDNPFYRFASIHSNPPGRATGLPAILRTTYGKGKVLWASAPIEAAIRPQHSDVFASMIQNLGGSFSFSSNAPDVIELIMFDVPEKRRLYISIINIQEHFKTLPVYDFDISVKISGEPVKAIMLPDEREISCTYSESNVVVHIDKVESFGMLAIEY